MARSLNQLNPRQITAVKNPLKPKLHADGGGLYLKVDPLRPDGQLGARRWVFLYQYGGKRREIGLGSVQDVTLERARELAQEARAQVRDGIDPKAVREAAKVVPIVGEVVTFGAYALQVLEVQTQNWHGRKTAPRWLNSINAHCLAIRDMPIADITTEHVLSVLTPLFARVPQGAIKTQGMMETVLDSATARGLRSGDNPARWVKHLDKLLPKRPGTKDPHASLPYIGIADLMGKVRDLKGVGAQALELAVLTGARTTEVREAPWSEFDLDGALWSIPRDRTKERTALQRAKVTHKRIPLSAQAITLLRKVRAEREDAGRAQADAFVFPGPKAGKPLGENGMSSVLTRLHVTDATVHGFRSTFRDWAAAQLITLSNGRRIPAYSYEACEIALGHSVGNKTTRAYFRGDLLEERRDLMDDWASYCDGVEPIYAEAPTDMSMLLLEFLGREPDVAARWGTFLAGRDLASSASSIA